MDQTVDTAEQTQTPAVARTPEVADKSTYRATQTDPMDQTVDKSERNSRFQPVYRSKRQRFQRTKYVPGTSGMECMQTLIFSLAKKVVGDAMGRRDYSLIYTLLMDHEYGILENLMPHVAAHAPHMLKASSKKDNPDMPNFHEAMRGPHREEFLEAMKKEITELESHGTWKLVRRSTLPEGTNVIPSTWAFKIKRFPDGRFRKTKARFCARGDKQIKGVDYFDTYAPVVNWATVQLLLCLSKSLGWKTRQVDFSNTFVQAKLDEDVYITTPAMFGDPEFGTDEVVMKLNRSLYGLSQAPLYWYNHLQKALEDKTVGFVKSKLDDCIFYGHGIIVLVYVDDVLFFGPNLGEIDKCIKALEALGLTLTPEGDETGAYAFLGVDIKSNPDPNKTGYVMTQKGLTEKVIQATKMEVSNKKMTPASAVPLSSDEDGQLFDEDWNYSSVVGMLLYLSSNSQPDIQYAVHQCA